MSIIHTGILPPGAPVPVTESARMTTQRKSRRITAVVGAQYGSEGKGVVCADLAHEYNIHVRTGGPNAGHSLWHKGRVWKMQCLPCGWINPKATLVIGRGAVVHIATLLKELEQVGRVDPTIVDRVRVDAGAFVIRSEHREAEGGTGGALHASIGSTGEGVGAARIARIGRDDSSRSRVGEFADKCGATVAGRTFPLSHFVEEQTSAWINTRSEDVLLEGTQGTMLSLWHGYWPFVTSHDCTAAQLAADAGIAPHLITDVLLVARTFPIRVAGNSGPLFQETDWETMSRRLGRPITEQTTVTKKTRRVGLWDPVIWQHALHLNRPTALALMFLDYLDPAVEGVERYDLLPPEVKNWVEKRETEADAPAVLLGTGPRAPGAAGAAGWSVIRRW